MATICPRSSPVRFELAVLSAHKSKIISSIVGWHGRTGGGTEFDSDGGRGAGGADFGAGIPGCRRRVGTRRWLRGAMFLDHPVWIRRHRRADVCRLRGAGGVSAPEWPI